MNHMTTSSPAHLPPHRDQPPAASARLDGVDLARFLAIVGMMTAHLLIVHRAEITTPSSWLDPWSWSAIADGRSSTLFGLLAGVSVALMARRPLADGGEAVPRLRLALMARGLAIAAVGIALEEVQSAIAVVLTVYGLVFMVMALVVRWRPRSLAIGAALIGLGGVVTSALPALIDTEVWTPHSVVGGIFVGGTYPALVWVSFGMVGMAIARMDLTAARTRRVMVGGGAAVAAAAYGLGAVVTRLWPAPSRHGTVFEKIPLVDLGAPEPDRYDFGYAWVLPHDEHAWQRDLLNPDAHSGGLLDLIGSMGFGIAVLGLCLLVCEPQRVRKLTAPLRAAGSMPLTFYIGHVLSTAYVAKVFVWDRGESADISPEEITRALTGADPDRSPDEMRQFIERMLHIDNADPKLVTLWIVSIVMFPVLAVLWRQRFTKGPAEEVLARWTSLVTAPREPRVFRGSQPAGAAAPPSIPVGSEPHRPGDDRQGEGGRGPVSVQ